MIIDDGFIDKACNESYQSLHFIGAKLRKLIAGHGKGFNVVEFC